MRMIRVGRERSMGFVLVLGAWIVAAASSLMAAEAPKAAVPVAAAPKVEAKVEAPQDAFRYGADLRLRQEVYDKIPGATGSAGDRNDYFRIRPDVWVEVDPVKDVTFRACLLNEHRYYNNPDYKDDYKVDPPYEFADELVFDNLYVDFKKLAGGDLNVRVGRQNLMYGNNRVVSEGTPGDGTRTFYFNAIKAVYQGIDKTQVEVFAVYNPGEDPLAMGDEERDINSYKALDIEDSTESGSGIYVMNKSSADMPVDAYAIYKQEGAYDTKAKTNATGYVKPSVGWQELDFGTGLIENEANDVVCLGVLLKPSLTKAVKGNLEIACQLGCHGGESVSAYMADVSLNYSLADVAMKPSLDVGVYYLSGNDISRDSDEGWNPLWARHTQASELIASTYSATRWSNLMMPNAKFTVKPLEKVKIYARVAYLDANEDDGPGDGRERGWLYGARSDFDLGKGLLGAKDKLAAHVMFDIFEPGDYYSNDDQSYFLRWEVMYNFM